MQLPRCWHGRRQLPSQSRLALLAPASPACLDPGHSTTHSLRRRRRDNTPRLWPASSLCLLVLLNALCAAAQSFISNGQFFTKGLAIVDAPAMGSPQHAGSNLVLAVDLSGDGKIDQSAFIPGSGAKNSYNSLEIYLVSSQTKNNLTIVNTTSFLTQEPGSTVKHLNFALPSCVDAGTYNLTFYENALIDGQARFSITPLMITVDSGGRSSSSKDASACESISNTLQDQPQNDTAPAINPFLDPDSSLFKDGTSSTDTAIATITVGTAGLPSQWTIESPGSTVTVTETNGVTTATLVVVSTIAATTTITSGGTSVLTTTRQTTTTVTAIMGSGDIGDGDFFPINGAIANSWSGASVMLALVLLTNTLFLL